MRPNVMRLSFAAAALASLTLLASQASGETFPYVYSDGNRSHMRLSGSIDEVVRVSKRWTGPFLWARINGRGYLMRDAAVLDSVAKAFATLDPIASRRREAERTLRPLERRVDLIEQRADELSDSLDDEGLSAAERESIESRVHQLQEERRAAAVPAREAQRAVDELERQEEQQERVAEKELERIIADAIRTGRFVRAD